MSAAILTCLVALAVVGLLYGEASNHPRLGFACKVVASLGFLALAVAGGALSHRTDARILVVGLALAAAGDVALAIRGRRAFIAGLGLFLLCQASYVAAFTLLAPVGTWPTPVALVPVAASIAAFARFSPELGSLRIPVLAYMGTITLMVVGAIAVATTERPAGRLILLGAILFYLSDVSVARDRFVRRAFVNRAFGLPAYYAGQLLMAWAAARL